MTDTKDVVMEKLTKEDISIAIRKFRAANNLSQQQLANKLGISNMQIMRWENGHTMPNLLAMRALRELKILPPPPQMIFGNNPWNVTYA